MSDNSLQLSLLIQRISDERGVKKKREVIQDILANEPAEIVWLFKQVIRYAYDSSIRFGISVKQISIPATEPSRPHDFESWVFTLLDEVIAEPSSTRKADLINSKLATLSAVGAQTLIHILGKDLRCGINESTINKAIPDLLTKFDVMLAKPFSARHVSSWPVMVEPKFDGLRVVAIADTAHRTVNFYTRSGKEISSLDAFKQEVLMLAFQFEPDQFESGETGICVAFDGEVTSGSFLDSLSQVRRSSEQVKEGTYHVFDALVRSSGHSPIALTDDELRDQGTHQERRERLQSAYRLLREHVEKIEFLKLTQSYFASSEEEVFALYNACRDAKLEGIIVKDPNAYYVKKRSSAWLKVKAKETLDLPVIGAFEGTGKYKGMLGGLIVDNEGVSVRVGGGFSDDQRKDFWDQMQSDSALVESGDRESCVLIDCPIEIEYQEKMPSGSLRHPVFVRLRRDKQLGAVGAF